MILTFNSGFSAYLAFLHQFLERWWLHSPLLQYCIVRYPLLLNHAVSFFLYRQITSPRVSDWKSHGETRTMSPTRIQTLLFNFPRIRQRRSCPSWHFTMILSKPSNLTAIPSTSLAAGKWMFPIPSSLMTFLLPNFFYLFPEAGDDLSISIRKTMFFSGLVWGRFFEPNFECPRIIWLCSPGHWIPANFSSCEIQTTCPILWHSGHCTLSPIWTILWPAFLLVAHQWFWS